MDSEVLERIPEVAHARREADATPGPRWILRARKQGAGDWSQVELGSYAQCRTLGLQLSDQGLQVCVEDHNGCVRLRLWPAAPAQDA